jgi:hypothetical protein
VLLRFIVLSLLTVNVYAIELLAYKDGSTGSVILQDAAVDKAWAAGPACLKDGSRIIGVNKLFKEKGLGYRDCSNGKVVRKHKALGYSVAVLKLEELSDVKIKQVLGK